MIIIFQQSRGTYQLSETNEQYIEYNNPNKRKTLLHCNQIITIYVTNINTT